MAEIGAQPGNTNAAKGRRWTDAINKALEKRSKATGIEELERLAEKFLDEVEAQGMVGFKELGDRIDGKSHQSQSTEHSGPDGTPIPIRGTIEFISAKSKLEIP